MAPEQEEKQQDGAPVAGAGIGDRMMSGLGVRVLTDEQLEMLRKQIAIYAVLSERLADMYRASLSASAQHVHDFSAGMMRMGSAYCDPLLSAGGGHRNTTRQRWTPTAAQLQVLERVYEESNGTPGRQRIREMTAVLAEHGQISENNVSNWFQNRRARCKRKQSASSSSSPSHQAPTNGESEEAEAGEESAPANKEKKAKPQPQGVQQDQSLPKDKNIQQEENANSPLMVDHMFFTSPEIGIDELIDGGGEEHAGCYSPYLFGGSL